MRRMLQRRLRISDPRQHIRRGKYETPREQQQRNRMRLRRAVLPSPYRRPNSSDNERRHSTEIAGKPEPAPCRIRPENDRNSEHSSQRQPRHNPERRRLRLRERHGRRSARASGSRRPRRRRSLSRNGRELLVDLPHLGVPIAIAHSVSRARPWRSIFL